MNLKKIRLIFIYCKSLSEIVFAILHYLIDNNYKINVCKYCDRFFITDTFKIPFCKDACPFPDKHIGKDCQYVKEQRMHSLSSKRRIDKNLEYKYSADETLYNFRSKCEEYKDIIKESPSIWNINNYSEFLDMVDKYKYNKKRTIGSLKYVLIILFNINNNYFLDFS